MKILAIDPGSEQSAYVLWDGKQILLSNICKNEQGLVLNFAPDALVIEKIESYGMAVGASVFTTCIWIGRFIERWLNHPVYSQKSWYLLPRREVKMHLCGSARAKDSNIRQALIDRFGAPGTKKNPGMTYGLSKDLWAAFAVAVTWWDNNYEKR